MTEYTVYSDVVSPLGWDWVRANFTWQDLARDFSWADLRGGTVPKEDVLSIDIERQVGDIFSRLRVGQAQVVLDNQNADYSPTINPLVTPERALSVKAKSSRFPTDVKTFADVTSYRNHAFVPASHQNPVFDTGEVGPSAAAFFLGDGEDIAQHLVSITDQTAVYSGLNEWTFEYRIRLTDPGSADLNRNIVSPVGSANMWHFQVSTEGPLKYGNLSHVGSPNLIDIGTLPTDGTVHIAVTKSGQVFSTYFDTALANTETITSPALGLAGDLSFKSETGESFVLEQVRIWDRALSQSELSAGRDRSMTGVESGLLTYVPFFDADPPRSGNWLKDKSGFSHHASLSGVRFVPGIRGDWAGRFTAADSGFATVRGFPQAINREPRAVLGWVSQPASPTNAENILLADTAFDQGSRHGIRVIYDRTAGTMKAERWTGTLDASVSASTAPGSPVHLAAIFTGSILALRQNGTMVGTAASVASVATLTDSHFFTIGAEIGGAPGDSVIDDAMVFDYEPTSAQITEAMSTGTVTGSPPIGLWDFEDGGSHIPLFGGTIDTVDANPELGQRTTGIRASDRAKQFRGVVNLPLILDTQVGSVAAAVLASDPLLDKFSRVDTILDTAPFAALNQIPVGEAVNDILFSGKHSVFVDGTGTLRLRERNFARFGQPAMIFTNEGLRLTHQLDADTIINDVQVISRSRRETSVATVADLNDTPQIGPDETLTFALTYRDPATDEIGVPVNSVITPVASQDWLVNAVETGSGSDLTSSFTLVFSARATDALVEITNDSGQTGFLTRFTIRGNPVSLVAPFLALKVDTPSREQFGKKTLQLDNRIPISLRFNQNYATLLISERADPVPQLSLSLKNRFPHVLNRELLETLSLVDSHTGVNSWYKITAIRHAIRPDRGLEHITRYNLDLSVPANFLILDADPQGRLDSDRVLGF